MDYIAKILIVYKSVVVFLICILISTMLLFNNQADQIVSLRSISLDFGREITNSLNWFVLLFNSIEENKELRKENMVLAFQNSQTREIIENNSDLRKLLDLKFRQQFDYTAAEIISWEFSPTISTVNLNIGKNDGIQKNMAVINQRGLVGKIILAGYNTSVCQLLTDKNFRVSSKVGAEDAVGILGFGRDNYAIMDIQGTKTVAIGDTVFTSSHGNIFPEGIKIGEVARITDKPDIFKTIKIKLYVDYKNLRNVLIIKNFIDDQFENGSNSLIKKF